MINRRGAALPVLLPILAGTATLALLAQIAGSPGGRGDLLVILSAAVMLTGIYGFLLLAYRDLLKMNTRMEVQVEQLKESVALSREDASRATADVLERVQAIEERELRRLEQKAGHRGASQGGT